MVTAVVVCKVDVEIHVFTAGLYFVTVVGIYMPYRCKYNNILLLLFLYCRTRGTRFYIKTVQCREKKSNLKKNSVKIIHNHNNNNSTLV